MLGAIGCCVLLSPTAARATSTLVGSGLADLVEVQRLPAFHAEASAACGATRRRSVVVTYYVQLFHRFFRVPENMQNSSLVSQWSG